MQLFTEYPEENIAPAPGSHSSGNPLLRRWPILALLAFALSQTAAALPITSGTGSYLTFRDCALAAPCDSGVPEQRAEDFTVAGASSAVGSNPTLGSASASASFGATAGAPILRAAAASSSTGRLGATTIAVQRYENTGAAAVTAFFGGDLTFSLTDVSATPSVFTGIEVQLALFTIPSGFIDVADSSDRFAIFDLFSWQDLPGVTPIYDSGIVSYTTSTAPGMPISLTTPGITADPGESFFVLARLLAIGAEGSTADASSTLVTGLFDSMDLQDRELLGDDSGIVAIQTIQTVPLPGTAALLLLGFAGLMGRRLGRLSRQ